MVTKIKIDQNQFQDDFGRTVIFRGINLGGSSKVPKTPDGASHRSSAFLTPEEVSFIGRPFPLHEAEEHFSRLESWGFNLIRFLTSWEAIEHQGPKQYDTAYLSYARDIIELARNYGFKVLIDPHQDVWSRFTGGDGAPAWIFEKIGLDWTKFGISDAAFLMHEQYPGNYPPLSWPSNANRFACATMFTLFFGGNDFAPTLEIEGTPVQEYLQSHYFDAIQQLMQLVKDFPHIIGYGAMNEPLSGYIGDQDLRVPNPLMPLGPQISGFDGMVAAYGVSRQVPLNVQKRFGIKQSGFTTINPSGISVWLPNAEDFWQTEGIWKIRTTGSESGQLKLLKPHYFMKTPGRTINFSRDFLAPFVQKMQHLINDVHPSAWLFLEGLPLKHHELDQLHLSAPTVNATHWYDGATLGRNEFNRSVSYDIYNRRVVLGSQGIQKMFEKQIQEIARLSKNLGECATIIGEFGIPFNMKNKQSYTTGNYQDQVDALTWSFNAIDNHFLSAILWNYTADNVHEWGDQWNGEDFSIFSLSEDPETPPKLSLSSSRAVHGFCRPYPRFIAGSPITTAFSPYSGTYTLEYTAKGTVDLPTEIYVPKIQYPKGYNVTLRNGHYERDMARQILYVFTSIEDYQKVEITRIK